MSAQVRLDAVIVAASRFLTGPDIVSSASGHLLPDAPYVCVVVIDIAVPTASRSAAPPRRPLSFLS